MYEKKSFDLFNHLHWFRNHYIPRSLKVLQPGMIPARSSDPDTGNDSVVFISSPLVYNEQHFGYICSFFA